MPSTEETEIHQLLGELSQAWERGDAKAFGERFQTDGTFTNVNGGFFIGREEFDRRHEDVFRGVFKSTRLALTVRQLRFVRADVAIADLDVAVSGCAARPLGAQVDPDGTLHSSLLLVLIKGSGKWWIATYHNVWQAARDYSKDTTRASQT